MRTNQTDVAAHRRQFLIARAPMAPGPDWPSIALPEGLTFLHQSCLRVRSVGAEGSERLLFGHPLGSATQPGNFADGLAGRFGWIDWPYLYPDPCALFPIYYGSTPQGLLISSSLSLAVQAAGEAPNLRTIRWRGALSWTPPETRIAGFRKLLRDQRLHIPSGRTEHVDRAFRPAQSVAQARDMLATDLVDRLSELRDCGGTVFLALTAGLDSRTLLAALLAAEVRFECITQTFKGVDANDITVADQLAKHLGVKHHVIGPQERDEAAHRMWCEHSAQTFSGADNNILLPHHQYRFLATGDVLLRGGGFEVGRRGGSWEARLRGLDFTNATGEALWGRLESGPPDPATVTAFDEWLAWRAQHDNGLDFTDSFFLDQRVGGWLSATEHSKDMLPAVSIPVANCQTILSALMTPAKEDRASGRLQREVIGQLAPGLLTIPINPKSFSDRAAKSLQRAKNMGKRRLKRLLGMGQRTGRP